MNAHKYLLFFKRSKDEKKKKAQGLYEKGRDEKHQWNVE
jgi:stalled ribosome alternative rescue factor ArfA